MINPDYINPAWGIPLGLLLALVWFFLWLKDRRKRIKLEKQAPSMYQMQNGRWIRVRNVHVGMHYYITKQQLDKPTAASTIHRKAHKPEPQSTGVFRAPLFDQDEK